jgi:acyl dehydratase
MMFARAIGDPNPIYCDPEYSAGTECGRIIAPPTFVRFKRQVWPGDTLTASATVQAIRHEKGQHYADLAISTRNQHGEEVLTGSATARIDA